MQILVQYQDRISGYDVSTVMTNVEFRMLAVTAGAVSHEEADAMLMPAIVEAYNYHHKFNHVVASICK